MKARIENNIIKLYNTLPQDFENILNFKNAEETIIRSKGFYNVIVPFYNTETQIIGQIYFDSDLEIFTYPIVNKTPSQIEQEQIEKVNKQADVAYSYLDIQVLKKLLADKIEAINETEALEYRTLYKPYRVGITLEQNERFYYPLNDKLYRVISAHTTQLDGRPDEAKSLYVEVASPGVMPNGVQPLGAHDAYKIGDKVIHNTFAGECIVDNNIGKPGVYGGNKL